jgi:FAD:protein FMN transferase
MLTRALDWAIPPSSVSAAVDEPRRHVFRSMGMDIALIGPEPRSSGELEAFRTTAGAVEGVFGWVDARFSRFRDDSELTTVNRRTGRWQRVSPMFAEVLRLSLSGARATEGLFDPTILPELAAAGYDRDYDLLAAYPPPVRRPPREPIRWRDVRLDGLLLFLPSGGALDFGGVAKGWAVDLAAGASAALRWAVIDAGGDLRVVGRPERPVPIGVAHPQDSSIEILQLGLQNGALATSSIIGRSWGDGRHHVIDPRTSLPARTGVVQATVWADTCTDAEILSKWALLSGPRVLRELPAALVMEDGRVVVSFHGAGEPAPC